MSPSIRVLLGCLWSAVALAGPARAGDPPTPITLAPGQAAASVSREEPQAFFAGENHAAPALAVSADGVLVLAAVRWQGAREQLVLRRSGPAGRSLGPEELIFDGVRCGQPRLAAGTDGAVWLTWSGRKTAPAPGDHSRQVFLRRVSPAGKTIVISEGGGRAARPQLAVAADGTVHLVWEHSPAGGMDRVVVAHRRVAAKGRPMGPAEIVSAGPFDRRPAVVCGSEGVFAAWDSLVDRAPSGAADPDYDLFLRRLGPGEAGPVVTVDGRAGIQAAPALLADPAGGVIVAYHSSHRHGLVKWWQIRRVRGERVETLAAENAFEIATPAGEQQGAEFPALLRLPSGALAVFARRSQGACFQGVDARGVGPLLDLTRAGWGARGIFSQAAIAADGELVLVRRARREVLLERLRWRKPGGPPAFVVAADPKKPAPGRPTESPRFTAGPPVEIFYGDLHMHSAVSDGTGPPDEILARAWAFGLDFAALTDHDAIVGKRTFPSVQDEIAWLGDLFDARPGFSVLHAYEWTTPPLPDGLGHYNVYFRDRGPAVWCGYRDACPDAAKLSAYLAAGRAIATPHHTSWTGVRWRALPERQQRAVEVISVHGSSENGAAAPIPPRGHRAGAYVVDGLAQGLRFGLWGGSDAHGLLWHHGLARKRDPWRCGLTGVLSTGNSRSEIFDALFARRVFASSGERLAVRIRIGDVPMGGEGKAHGPVSLHFEVIGSGPLKRVVIVRDGRVLHAIAAEGKRHLSEVFQDVSVAPGRHSYYLRAEQSHGAGPPEVVWSSPIFVTVGQ